MVPGAGGDPAVQHPSHIGGTLVHYHASSHVFPGYSQVFPEPHSAFYQPHPVLPEAGAPIQVLVKGTMLGVYGDIVQIEEEVSGKVVRVPMTCVGPEANGNVPSLMVPGPEANGNVPSLMVPGPEANGNVGGEWKRSLSDGPGPAPIGKTIYRGREDRAGSFG